MDEHNEYLLQVYGGVIEVCQRRNMIFSLKSFKKKITIGFISCTLTFESRHEISNNVVCATSKASD